MEHYALVRRITDNGTISIFSTLAAELGVVLLFSFFEQGNNSYYNTVVVIDAEGQMMGRYRKNHISDGPGN